MSIRTYFLTFLRKEILSMENIAHRNVIKCINENCHDETGDWIDDEQVCVKYNYIDI